MPVLYSVISRGTTILTKYALCNGNFVEVTEQIIPRMETKNHKFTYLYGDYSIHYIWENNIIYMCFTDKDFDQSHAFLFLTDVKQKFLSTYGLQVATAIAYAMNTEFSKVLMEQMTIFNSPKEMNLISKVHGDIDELKDIMVRNIDEIKERGEKLELLVNKTQQLDDHSTTFRQGARNLARKMYWKRIRLYVIVALVILFIVYVIGSMICGGLGWQTCVGK